MYMLGTASVFLMMLITLPYGTVIPMCPSGSKHQSKCYKCKIYSSNNSVHKLMLKLTTHLMEGQQPQWVQSLISSVSGRKLFFHYVEHNMKIEYRK